MHLNSIFTNISKFRCYCHIPFKVSNGKLPLWHSAVEVVNHSWLPYYITSRHIITCICTYTIQGILKGLASLPLMGWVVGTGADVRTLYHWIYTQRYVSNLTLSRATGGSYPGVRYTFMPIVQYKERKFKSCTNIILTKIQ